MLVCIALAVAVALVSGCAKPTDETVAPVHITPAPAVEALRVRVLRKYPHDEAAFTQGLIWHDGVMYESSGQYGKSSLRKVRLEDGKVLAQRELDPNLFGAGAR